MIWKKQGGTKRTPSIEHGFKRAAVDLLSGTLSSIFINMLSTTLEFSEVTTVIFNFIGIISMLTLFEKMKYWSLLYSLGYFTGILPLGRFLMEDLQLVLCSVVLLSYILVKAIRKVEDYL